VHARGRPPPQTGETLDETTPSANRLEAEADQVLAGADQHRRPAHLTSQTTLTIQGTSLPVMPWQMPFLIVSLLVFVGLFAHVVKYRNQEYARWCLAAITLSICALIVVAMESFPGSLSEKILLWKVRITFGLLLTPLFFIAILRYLRRASITAPELVLILLVPVTTITLGWLMSPLYRWGFSLDGPDEFPVLQYRAGPWVWIQSTYHIILGVAFICLLYRLLRQYVKWAPAARVILLLCTLPGIMDTAYVLRFTEYNMTWIALGPAGLAILLALSGMRLSKLAPVSRTALMEQTDNLILVIDADGHVVDMNSAAGKALAVPPGEAIGRKAASILPDSKAIDDLLAKTGKEIIEIRLGKSDYSDQFECKMTPVWNAGEICARILSMENITPRKIAAERLNAALKAAEDANAAKSRFLASMSHEIRTPLNSILGYSQIISRRTDIPTDARLALVAIEESGDHLLRLLEGILDMSKIEAGCMNLNEAEFDLTEVLCDLRKIFSRVCDERGLAFGGDMPPNQASQLVRGDETKLRQVLFNLLGNAAKFTEQGEVQLRVEPLADGFYRFEVCDTGRGLTPDDHATIFAPFGQTAEGARKGGTGLGIPISARLLEIMDSRLEVESTLGKGSRFHFSLRLPPASSTCVRANDLILHLGLGCEVRALVADDDKASRDLLEIMLREIGCNVFTVDNGEEASAALDRDPPHIAFIDANMPGMSGTEVVARHRSKPGQTRFVCYSASVFRHEWNLFAAAGYHSLLSKPCHYHNVYDELEKIPKVRLEPLATAEDPPSFEASFTIPRRIGSKILEAIDLGDFASVREILSAQESAHAIPEALARRIRNHAQRFDRQSLRKLVAGAIRGPMELTKKQNPK